jgi:hypothetical protein
VYLPGAASSPGDLFHLITAPLATFGPPPYLAKFWYHRYGQHIGQLNVYEVFGDGNVGPPLLQLPEGSFTGQSSFFQPREPLMGRVPWCNVESVDMCRLCLW